MKVEAIKAIEELVRESEETQIIELDGIKYVDRQVIDLRKRDPEPDVLELHTLTSLVDYIRGNRDELLLEQCVLHIVSPQQVDLRSRLHGHFHQRPTFARARAVDLVEAGGLKLGRYHPVEELIIGIQSLFVASDDRAEVLRVLGNVKDEAVRTQADDGVTQQVSVRSGALVDALQVPNPVTLAPYRTFREVEQPSSPLVFRVKKTDQGITAALFEADGGAWRLEAVKRIREWLEVDGVEPVVVLG